MWPLAGQQDETAATVQTSQKTEAIMKKKNFAASLSQLYDSIE